MISLCKTNENQWFFLRWKTIGGEHCFTHDQHILHYIVAMIMGTFSPDFLILHHHSPWEPFPIFILKFIMVLLNCFMKPRFLYSNITQRFKLLSTGGGIISRVIMINKADLKSLIPYELLFILTWLAAALLIFMLMEGQLNIT
jgi:hypothetical protein